MKIARKFTKAGEDPFATTRWITRSSRISNPDGSVVFEMADAEVPEGWSQLATDIMVSKYFRKAGVPQLTEPYALHNVPDDAGELPEVQIDEHGAIVTGPERSARQVIHRLAGCWRHWGETHGYFDKPDDAQAFYDELVYMLIHQMAAPNSPQWFNTGLAWAYGISGPAQGHWVVDPATGMSRLADDAYTHPQPHACFIQSVEDDLVNQGGIMDLWVREARLFKYGSGTGTNFSQLRGEGEALSGGGKSSGLMSWLRIGDRAAAAIKSGGTTRRAAKMVCLDMDHPDIGSFVDWKVREELKVAALVEGQRALSAEQKAAAERMGLKMDYDFNGEAYQTVSGQNSNNSVRIPDSFFDAVDANDEWRTTWRTTGEVAHTYDANDLWDRIGYAAWRCADPGVQYDTTINAWHTCPGAGRINASNPCSEYMFIDNTACNLASLNVLKFYDPASRQINVEKFEHATDLWTVVLEISVLMAAFPSREIAELSYTFRTLGLGYANLGAVLMRAGVPYDSSEATAICACLTAILTGRSYRASAMLAKEHGPFAGYASDKYNMLRVIRNHRLAAHGIARDSDEYEGLRIRPLPIDHGLIESGRVPLGNAIELLRRAAKVWDDALEYGAQFGFRNAQVSVIAPTGTIGLLMDCDTTGVEPDFALVKFKKLAGGGYFKIANASVRPALEALGYSEEQIGAIMRYLMGTLDVATPLPEGVEGVEEGSTLAELLLDKGMLPEEVKAINEQLPSVFELKFAFGPWSIGDDALERMGIDAAKAKADPSFNLLRVLGLSSEQIESLNEAVCGTQTLEGAPHLKPEHMAVFDCASACGRKGTRFIAPEGHIRMMAAAQPFISGAISKTINLPHNATVDDIKRCYRLSWELGLKANALYRDGCKLSQPLNTKSDAESEVDLEDEEMEASGEPEALEEVATAAADLAAAAAEGNAKVVVKREVEIIHRPMRRRLPDTRRSLTHKFNIAGHEGYLTVGLYEDGQPGELFITMAKEGSTIGGLMDSLGTATSVALQYGVPLESMVKKFTHQRFEPAGMTGNREIPFAKSLVDYIFRWLGIQFVPGYREAVVPRRGGDRAIEPRTPTASDGDTARRTLRVEFPTASGSVDDGQEKTKWTSESRPDGSPNRGESGASSSAPRRDVTATTEDVGHASSPSSTLSIALDSAGDAPPCDVCGTITVRSGTCYKCLNCGNSMGCS